MTRSPYRRRRPGTEHHLAAPGERAARPAAPRRPAAVRSVLNRPTRPAPNGSRGAVPDETITLSQAAERLGVHYMTAYRYVRTGRLPASKDGSEWRVAVADVETMLSGRSRRRRRRWTPSGGPGHGRRRRRDYHVRLETRLLVGDEAGVVVDHRGRPHRRGRPRGALPRGPGPGHGPHRRRLGCRAGVRRPGAPGLGRRAPTHRSARPPVHPPGPQARDRRARCPAGRPPQRPRRPRRRPAAGRGLRRGRPGRRHPGASRSSTPAARPTG